MKKIWGKSKPQHCRLAFALPPSTRKMLNNQSLSIVQQQLAQFAAQDNFQTVMTTAFGAKLNAQKLSALRQQLLSGNFSIIPQIAVLTHGELGTANGAYAAATDQILISADFWAQASSAAIASLILEEVGHRIDQLFNDGRDSAGDEGEIFSRLVQGEILSSGQLAQLKGQDDRGTIFLQGQAIAIEKQDISGTLGNDNLLGTVDADAIFGYDGADSIDGAAGDDQIVGGDGNDTLIGNLGDDFVYGDGGNDALAGGSGNDYVDGGLGLDTLYGLAGDDVLDGGFDRDYLLGGDGDDEIYGGEGSDTLDGGLGIDTLIGGVGSDSYIVDNIGDVVVENLHEGRDTVFAAINYSLGNNLDDLTLFGTANLNGTGNGANNIIKGNSGINRITGGAGNDKLIGGGGNDIYVIDADVDLGADVITEIADASVDTLDFRGTTTKTITINLGTTTIQTIAVGVQLTVPVVAIENVSGGALNDSLTGNALGNKLLGGAGNDTLTGGSGSDSFCFSGVALTGVNTVATILGRDTITDFAINVDKIALSKATFAAITSAVNAPIGANFVKVANDTLVGTQSAAIVYSQSSGNLFYNQNGAAAGYGTGGNFAVLTGLPNLSAGDFIII
jgi:Ca2+-binding RTX toxin-like protein